MDKLPEGVKIGKNAKDNWKIYSELSQNGTIFHLEKFSSPYVTIDRNINELDKQTIIFLSSLCKDHSKYRGLSNVSVLYTSKSNTKLGDRLGEFVVKSNRLKMTILV